MTGRKPLKIDAVEVIDPTLDQPKISSAMAQMRADDQELTLVQAQHDSAVRAVAMQVGYQLPADCTDPDLIQRDISANMRRSLEACLEVGRGLAVLKAACGHGNFMARLDVLGVDVNVAGKFMQAARRLSNSFSTMNLSKAISNQTKLFEILVLGDDQLEELELTGQSGDLQLDQIATMSVKELRAALKEAKAEKVAHDKLVANLHANNDELKLELHRVEILPPDKQLVELHKSVAGLMTQTSGFIVGKLRQGFVALAEHHQAHGGDSREVMAGHVAKLQKDLNELRDRFMLPNPVGDGTPAWKQWAAQQAADDAPKA